MKAEKAPGMLKTDIHFACRVFTDLFRDIWTNYVIANDWNKGLIVKLPMMGGLQHCDNWRRIAWLSALIKIFGRVLLNRKEGAIVVKLRQEQVGFRRGKCCTYQIFVLHNIIEQSIEWNALLCIGFIDFKKS